MKKISDYNWDRIIERWERKKKRQQAIEKSIQYFLFFLIYLLSILIFFEIIGGVSL